MNDEDQPPTHPADGPLHWELLANLAEIYGDANMGGDVTTINDTVQRVGGTFGRQGLGDMAALLLSRLRVVDNTTPGHRILAHVREDLTLVQPYEGEFVATPPAAYQVAAMDQVAPVLALALDLDHRDGRSIAAFIRQKMNGSPTDHYAALLGLAGGTLTSVRRMALEETADQADD